MPIREHLFISMVPKPVSIAPDIHKELFDRIFDAEVFSRWVRYRDRWQLHVIGGLGSGKISQTCEKWI